MCQEYKELRNLTQHTVNKAKKNLICNEIDKKINYLKKLWQTLNEIGLPTKHKASSATIGLKSDE